MTRVQQEYVAWGQCMARGDFDGARAALYRIRGGGR